MEKDKLVYAMSAS